MWAYNTACHEVDADLLDDLAYLGQRDVGPALSVFHDQLDLPPRHLRADLVQVQRQAVDHVLGRLRRRPGEVGDEADPDRPRLSRGHADTREEEDQQGAQHDREPVRTHGRSSWWTGLRQMIAPSACYRDVVWIAHVVVLLWATTV